ncbi:MAG: hypothetical protein HFI87_00550 [Bacilli bacterium]|nr:hypothetical protein [Bacilli bacterium]
MKIIWNNMEINIIMCKNFKTRLLGLMFKKEKIDYALCFPKCNSIHTFFMKQNIDIVMTDINNTVIYVIKNLKPWKIILPKKNVFYTYEFSANLVDYKIGDIITIKKS